MRAVLAHIENGVPRVLVPAINRALAKGRTEVKREIRKEYLIKAKDIPVIVHQAHAGNIGGSISLSDHMLDLSKFVYKPKGVQRRGKKRILFAQVKRGGGGNIGPGFVAQVGSGYKGPFMRKGASRLPINKLLTISAPIMASQVAVGPNIVDAMAETLDKRLDHELERVLKTATHGGH